jgi:hypothetical protein
LRPAFNDGARGLINQSLVNQVAPEYLRWYGGIAQSQIAAQTACVAEGGNVAPALNTIYLQSERLTQWIEHLEQQGRSQVWRLLDIMLWP